ncbi:MAG: hypothetical protein P8P36_05410 [Akkermansiaceae bacterium]|nr:hypothetical protein [Akkermansiaceae bacterium]
MKTSIRKTTACAAALGLAALPMLATVHANVAEAAAADAITNTASVYLVQVSGKG